MSSFWNERYSQKEYVYGEEPNVFFAEQMDRLKAGTIILPCEGEGRNAVYAASKGWEVNAFDMSIEGKNKALKLAEKQKVLLNYIIEDASLVDYQENSADVVAFIFSHLPEPIRKQIYARAITWLKPGGRIILEVFNPLQLNNNSGGPKDITMLCTEEILLEDFAELEIELLMKVQTELKEGKYHEGKADVIRFVGVKKQIEFNVCKKALRQ